jgi:cysteine desulfurase
LVRHDVRLTPDMFGGPQQQGFRPGTEPVALAVGMCRALELWDAERDQRCRRMEKLRDRFESALLAGWPNTVILGRRAPRLPHTSNVAIVGIDRQAMFMALDQAGLACSTGSACASGSSQVSPAHVAMRCEDAVARSALRFSLGATTTEHEVDEAVRRILSLAQQLQRGGTR